MSQQPSEAPHCQTIINSLGLSSEEKWLHVWSTRHLSLSVVQLVPRFIVCWRQHTCRMGGIRGTMPMVDKRVVWMIRAEMSWRDDEYTDGYHPATAPHTGEMGE